MDLAAKPESSKFCLPPADLSQMAVFLMLLQTPASDLNPNAINPMATAGGHIATADDSSATAFTQIATADAPAATANPPASQIFDSLCFRNSEERCVGADEW